MRDLVDIGGYEGNCGEGYQQAEIVSDARYCYVMVGNNCIAKYDMQADDYAYTHAQEHAERWNRDLM